MSTIEESVDVEVPVSTAYSQWTQFESFPRFMDGVERVEQRDDTLLHWVAEIGGVRHEWDARITEQQLDRLTVEYLAEHFWIVGSPDTVVEKLVALQEETGGFGTLLGTVFDYSGEREAYRRCLELVGTEASEGASMS